MSFWSNIKIIDSNSYTMEYMIMFHDYSMMLMTSIIIFLMMKNMFMITNKVQFLNFFENQKIEFIWTSLPVFMLILLMTPSLRLLYLMEEYFSPHLTIKIIGHQWYWSYEYTDFKLNFDSFMMESTKNSFRNLETNNYICMPINSLVRLLTTSSDVIHSWTIPSLGVKTDAIPGRLNQMNMKILRPGLFFGQCSEICGINHSFMPISLKILNLENFYNFIKNF